MFSSSVDSILADIMKKTAQLRALAEKKDAEAGAIRERIDDLVQQERNAYIEAERADRLANRFEELVR